MRLPLIIAIDGSAIAEHLNRIERKLDALIATQRTDEGALMATMQDIKDEVTQLKTVDESVKTLLTSLSDRVAALQPNQADIDQLAADIKAEVDGLSQAVTDNTPASAPPAPAA